MSEPCLLKRSRPATSVLDFPREEIVAVLRESLRARGVEAAYIFGSLARGRPDAWSDIDLIVVCETDDPFVERPRRFWDLPDLGVPMDVLVYTPEEFARLWDSDSGFWKTVRDSHIRIV